MTTRVFKLRIDTCVLDGFQDTATDLLTILNIELFPFESRVDRRNHVAHNHEVTERILTNHGRVGHTLNDTEWWSIKLPVLLEISLTPYTAQRFDSCGRKFNLWPP